MSDPRLIIFDVDGTLVDSQSEIVAAMTLAHQAMALPVPAKDAILSIVGLSLPEGFAILHPASDDALRQDLSEAYRQSYFTLRTAPNAGEAAFYPGMRALLDDLLGRPDTLLAVATGKSRRGLDRLLHHHGLEGHFVTTQVSDDHPSKPHPSMILAALNDSGIAAEKTCMIGDTTFDMQMAAAAGVRGIGVGWGYHRADELGADALVHNAAELRQLLYSDKMI